VSKQYIQPPELFPSKRFGFTQVVSSPPGKLVFVSGQVGWDAEMKLAGADLAEQTRQALGNLAIALRAAGASTSDLTMVRTYIVGYKAEYAQQLAPLFDEFLDGATPPASTWIGVQALAAPDLLIEIEAVAVVGD
jgi:enamine deaminase RidA (YjgF/YER057c/UK114 family)